VRRNAASALRFASEDEAAAPGEPRADAPRLRPIPRIDIVAFCEDKDTAAVIRDASAGRRLAMADVAVRMGGVQAAVMAFDATPTPSLLVIESLLDRDEMLADLDRLAEICDPATKVIAVGHVNDVLLYRELLRRGVSDYLMAPLNVPQLIDCIAASHADAEAAQLGKVLAFIGAKGGAGSSTVCHNIAFAIAAALRNEVVIADLDLPFGTAGLDFNQDPMQGIADALISPERLNETQLNRLLSRCSDHLSLLAAPGTLDRVYDIDSEACGTVLDVVKESVPWIAVGVPHLWTSWAKQVLSEADEVVITAVPDLANLRNARNLVDQLKLTRPSSKAPLLVLNQVGMPKRPEIAVKDFADALELELSAAIGFDPQLFGMATNNGQTIEEVAPKSKAATQFRDLAALLTDGSAGDHEDVSLLALILNRLRLTRTRG
jgi:pilus assembly protein CpaE